MEFHFDSVSIPVDRTKEKLLARMPSNGAVMLPISRALILAIAG